LPLPPQGAGRVFIEVPIHVHYWCLSPVARLTHKKNFNTLFIFMSIP